MSTTVSLFDKFYLVTLAIFYKTFSPLIRLFSALFWQAGNNLSVIFFIKTSPKLIGKFSQILRLKGYPVVNQSIDDFVSKVNEGYSISRFGDGEYSMLKADVNSVVYFDTATHVAKEQLLKVLTQTEEKHLIALIHEDVVASQLPFANALSMFKGKFRFTKPRMPLLSEFEPDMLSLYAQCASRDCVFETGVLRNMYP